MKWSEDLFEGNSVEVKELLSKVAALLVDEAEAFRRTQPRNEKDEVRDIVDERLNLANEALEERINQQLTVRGYGE